MAKLHELLAVEPTRSAAAKESIGDFKKKSTNHTQFFAGRRRTLSMFVDDPANKAAEAAESNTQLPTTNVIDTLAYTLGLWAKAEDVRASKNLTNTKAFADVMMAGAVFLSNVPTDTLMGLIAQAKELKEMLAAAPTVDPTKHWTLNSTGKYFESPVVTSIKTRKIEYGLELSPATDKHPAQVKVATKDEPIGKFEDQVYSGLWTTNQKAAALAWVDEFTVELKAALQRANQQEVEMARVGQAVSDALLNVIASA